MEPRRPLPSAPEPERRCSARGRPGPPKPALCRHPGWVGASCHPGRVPTRPRTEAPGLAAPGAHGHAVQSADTSTARGAQGGHWGGTRWDGVGWGGDSGARGGRVGGRTGTVRRFLRPRCAPGGVGMEAGHPSGAQHPPAGAHQDGAVVQGGAVVAGGEGARAVLCVPVLLYGKLFPDCE